VQYAQDDAVLYEWIFVQFWCYGAGTIGHAVANLEGGRQTDAVTHGHASY